MEEVSHPDFIIYQNYAKIHKESPSWSTHDPPAAASPTSHFQINFTFSCEQHFSEWIISEGSRLPHLSSQHCQREEDKSVLLNLDEFLNINETCFEFMAVELIELPLTNEQCTRLVHAALKLALRVVASPPTSHNVLNLHLHVEVVHKYMIRRARDLSRVMQESFDVEAQKVPAAEAAVEMVMKEKVQLNEMETCTICLEEVQEAVLMPCSHVFHGGCIVEWLRNDHRCPLCRFQMPVAMETSN